VGKSALLNRLIGRREAIVEDTPGVTRDRIYRDATWNNRTFTLVDTGGILINDPDNLRQMIKLQVEAAINEADLIVFVVDIRDGINPLDQDVADLLRHTQKKILLAVNKADNEKFVSEATEFYALGMGEPIAVSAVQGIGTGDLLDEIVQNLPEEEEEEAEEEAIRISIVGRPNVGKSSLLNAILGEERAIVTDIPGTTRDAVDSTFNWAGHKFIIVDTAGLRRKSKVNENIEFYSTQRAKQAIKRCNIGLLVLDATDPGVMQDRRVGGLLHEDGKGVVIVVNKWDLISAQKLLTKEMFEKDLKSNFDFLTYAPVVFTSALYDKGIKDILPTVLKVYMQSIKKVDTPILNQVFQEAFRFRPPPSYKGNALKLFYTNQVGVNPPTFVLKVNNPKLVHFSYKRYLENQLRKAFSFEGNPIRLIFKR
jgi:GTP-binding protein